MKRILPLIIKERFRRIKKYVTKNPIIAVGTSISIIYGIYYLISTSLTNQEYVRTIVDNQYVSLVAIVYLAMKILNPTQETMIDYQLIELKLISFIQYKLLLLLKFFFTSMILIIFFCDYLTNKVFIICMLNVVVNIWAFLRNRWNYRVIDLVLSVALILCIKNEWIITSVVIFMLMLCLFMFLHKVNYENIIPMYKINYMIGQQFSASSSYTAEKDTRIKNVTEELFGRKKQHTTIWCEKYYDVTWKFEFAKELSRMSANLDKILSSILVSIVVCFMGYYLPEWYLMIAFSIIVLLAININYSFNGEEQNLLKLGYIACYSHLKIIKYKFVIYALLNFIIFSPTIMFGVRFVLLSILGCIFTTIGTLYKCFRKQKS